MTEETAVIAIDVGGTKILAGLVGRDGKIHSVSRRPTVGQSLLDDICELSNDVFERARPLGLRVEGIGVATKGFVDPDRRMLVRSMSMGVEGLRIGDEVEARTGLPVFVNNDVHACTKGEMLFGVGRRHRNFLVYNAGTGVSSGIVSDGRLHVGAGGVAGEVGHMAIAAGNGGKCKCGRNGCLEDLVIRARDGEAIALADDSRLDPLPLPYKLLAIGLANLVNVFNPSAVALVGGMFLNNLEVAERFGPVVRRLCLVSAADSLAEIGVTANGYEAGLIGAGTLPFLAGAGRDTVPG
ncbi:ROK family protein [Psychromarinibacter sp. S121]|uniref:ROK family protein n=1 Tax=Psychromarinibacter sp. S121 TaxID=3415127 RepID=UPI003C7B9480